MRLEEVARKVMWWASTDEALRQPLRLLAQIMVYGDAEDIITARAHFTPDDFRAVISHPPVGLFDNRSWHYWNLLYGVYPPPPLPSRDLSSGQEPTTR